MVSASPLRPQQERRSRRQALAERDWRREGLFSTPQWIDRRDLVPGTLAPNLPFDGEGRLDLGLPPPNLRQSGLSFSWVEHVGREKGYTQGYTYGHDNASVTMTIDCAWNLLLTGELLGEILGWSAVAHPATGASYITRIPPWKHPSFDGLWAQRIVQVEGVKFVGKSAFDLAMYQLARVTILFSHLPYRVLDDDQLAADYGGKEYRRWTTREQRSASEMQTSEKFQWKWAQGAAGDVDAPRGKVIGKDLIPFHWLDVPAEALYGPQDAFAYNEWPPTYQDGGVGKVNANTFLGFPKETLLLDSWEARPKLAPALLPLFPSNTEPPLLYDVVFNFVYLDPPAVDKAVARGHNVTPRAQQEKWHLMNTYGTPTGPRMYESYDFPRLFWPNLAPP